MMNKRLLNNVLYGALLFSLGTGVVSCKDYDDDIEGLNNRITTVESDMERFKEKIEAALNANLTVQSWYPSEDQSQYTIVLSNGDELYVQASNKATPFYQFKIEDGTWRYSSDKGAGWNKVLESGTEKEIPGTEKDQLYYDKSNGYIYIQKTESLVQTSITVNKETPILAENKENKTLSIYIYGENYILPIQGGGFSGISSILFQKQFVFEEDEYLEAASYTNTKGEVVTAHTATAKFKILPKDIDLSEATFACADIHELKLTRAAAPQLLVEALNNGKLDENGILTVELTPQDMPAEYYGAVLEITLDKTTTSSNYFVVKPTSYNASEGQFAYRETREFYQSSESLKFISTESLDLSKAIGWGFGESGEVKFVDELGFGDLTVKVEYELVDNPNNTFAVTEKGILTATSANKTGKLKVTYIVAEEEFSKEILVYSQDESTAKSGIELSGATEMLSDIETLYKGTKVIEVSNSQTTLESLGVTTSKAWKLGVKQPDETWKVIEMTTSLSDISKKHSLANGEVCLYYDATDKKSYLLVGPQTKNIENANLFAMNEEATDKENFDHNGKQIGVYVGNVKASYVVENPTKKPELEVMIYAKGGIDKKPEELPKGDLYYGKHFAIPGVYDTENGYYFKDIDFRSLYNFKPADAEFVFTMNEDDQNQYVKEKWGGSFAWHAENGTLTVKNDNELYKYNLLNKKPSELGGDKDKVGIQFSWKFNAGEGEVQSDGKERWFIKDPTFNPGDNITYLNYDKNPNATGVISTGYSIKVKDLTNGAHSQLKELVAGEEYDLGKAFGNIAFWRNGCAWDVYGGPNKLTGAKLPALVKYSDELGRLAITDYCKTYFGKRRAELKLNTEGDCGSYFTVTDPDNFKIKVTAPKDGGNVQFKVVFNTDYSTQNIIFFVEN